MQTKHTPGPWQSSESGDTVFGPPHRHPQSTRLGVEMQSEPIICFVRGYHGSEEAEANASLIASAPELLAAVKIAHEFFINPGKFNPLDVERMYEAAIAKAEGKV